MSESITLGEVSNVPLSEITLYPDNARIITEQAISAVVDSIQRFGFVQPVVVNAEGVVLAGHTRVQAAKRMGLTEVPTIRVTDLTEAQEAEFRLVDNKTSEMTQWDHGALMMELREFEDGLREEYFPDIDLKVEQTTSMQVTDEDLRKVEEKVLKISKGDAVSQHETKVECPSCYYVFTVRTKSLPGLTWNDLNKLVYGDD